MHYDINSEPYMQLRARHLREAETHLFKAAMAMSLAGVDDDAARVHFDGLRELMVERYQEEFPTPGSVPREFPCG